MKVPSSIMIINHVSVPLKVPADDAVPEHACWKRVIKRVTEDKAAFEENRE